MQEALINHLGGLSLPRNSVVRLTDRPEVKGHTFRESNYAIFISAIILTWG